MPSVKPPVFKGDTKSQPPHEAQYAIQDYLRQAKNAAQTNDLRGDGEVPRFRNHKTWVTWLKSGLQGEALRLWDELPDLERNDMTWARYQQWIHDTFSSPLTLEGAWSSLVSLRQTGSCVDYNKKFNVLKHAIEAEGISIPEKIICIEYRRGLKDNLAKEPVIMEYDQITALQTHAERLDKMQHDRARMSSNSKNDPGKNHSFRNSGTSAQQSQKNNSNGAGPMEIGTKQGYPQKLTKEEKDQYRRNGWCTFCRSKEHNYDNCTSPNKKRRAQVNAVEATTSTNDDSRTGAGEDA
ncbi:hypothetical protein HDU67_004108 [Dinochytrium kinnereticum]|nr:hypothetical protein HDU67_004108 [Dinochytrium kinnereticum]